MTFNWNEEKNEALKQTRNISFEEIVIAIDDGMVVDVLHHPNQDRYPGQRIYLVEYRDYIYAVPHVRDETKNEIFLKTIFPTRRYTKIYLRSEEGDE